MLQTLIYHSRPTDSARSEIEVILDQSDRNNAISDLTGMLAFNGEFFLQVLEGGREAVGATFARIAQDPRHEGIQVVAAYDIRERSFWSWRMRYVSALSIDRDQLLRYGPSARFDPRSMTAEALVALCRDWGRREAA